jgi:hypothetical protein
MKLIPWLLVVVACLALVLQYKCGGRALSNLQTTLDETRVRDSLNVVRQSALLDSNLSLNAEINKHDMIAGHKIDSLTKITNQSKEDLKFDNTRIKNFIDIIRDYGKQNKDSVISAYADSLEAMRESVTGKVVYVFATDDKKDSVYKTQIDSLHSALVQKDTTIAREHRNWLDRGVTIEELRTAASKAIKSGKRKNILDLIEKIGAFILGALVGHGLK